MHEPDDRDAQAPAAARDPNTGRVLDGRYRIGARIARGGMASVYEATDLRLDRTVAVKIMHSGLGDPASDDDAFATRFVREARAAARLSHPNVVSIYDQGQDADPSGGDGTLFIVMELVPGHTLRDTITKEAPMAPERALALLDPVLSALASAHRAGLIHRDIKPENVLIADDGRIKVADFGLAKAVSADTQHTATAGVLIGTVSYLAPELVVDGTADPRADVYAVGVLLYELLTGVKPHTGESPIQVAYRHVHHDVPAPSARVPGLPPYVDALVARATSRDHTLRPADAGVLLHHVRRVQAALRDGLVDDPELVADLLPQPRAVVEVTDDTTPEAVEELWDEREVEALFGPPTTAARPDDRPPPPAPESTQVISHPDVPPAPPRRRRPVKLLLVLLLVLAIGGGAYWFGWGRYTSAPGVVGMSDASATADLEKAGFTVEHTDPVYSDSVPKGDVVSSDPGAGDRVLSGGTVTLTVSRGPELHDVPDVAGMGEDEARDRLAEAKLVVGRVVQQFSETVPDGDVIRTDPRFGTPKAKQLPVDSAVRLIVSKGRQPIKVKDWVGEDVEEATAYWEGKGLEVDVEASEYSDTVAEGAIIAQDPARGTLYRGDTVTVTESKGPELVEIPSVFYDSADDAVEKLEALGLEVVTKRAAIYFNGSLAYSTDPPAGSKVRKGSTVTVYVV
ncbi:Stk1 family PASTA domain-containing Ser/Thr kinase [Nocardioides sambongensis]|uniref:Stk1 family PASTA domain-containing Ser/Thr kinase n=1 Tax=Nocardioides sambongensis TaxID=2589074 RepID=UPI00112E0FC6|nr:Stk1 family PASTA domain-containing Ser/Thr kinase [Nocardioides sambongensis]